MRSIVTGRGAARIVVGFLVAFSVPNVYWGLGGDRGIVWVVGCDCLPIAAVWIQQAAIILGIAVLLVRTGIWHAPFGSWMFRVATWGMAATFGAVALSNSIGDNTVQARALFAPVAAVMCVLCVIVARSPRDEPAVSAR